MDDQRNDEADHHEELLEGSENLDEAENCEAGANNHVPQLQLRANPVDGLLNPGNNRNGHRAWRVKYVLIM